MKEQIYTIPINEALDKGDGCPFCKIYNRLEKEAIEYTLGPAMMDPSFRMITNDKGFCKRHIRDLHGHRQALSLSLVLDTHMAEVMSMLEKSSKPQKKSLFKKTGQSPEEFVLKLRRTALSCAVCSRIDNTFTRYFETFVFMLKTENGFLDKVLSKNGFCVNHFSRLAQAAVSGLSDKEYEKYFIPLVVHQKEKMEKIHADIKKFSDSFDYRNVGKPTNVPKDILLRACVLMNGEFEPKE